MNFIDNLYTREYYSIIDSARAKRRKKGDGDNHHIIPEAFFKKRSRPGPPGWLDGDAEAADNKVRLTGDEHFMCHWLLTKMTTGLALESMIYALNGMKRRASHMDRPDAEQYAAIYAEAREQFSEVHSRRMKEQFANGRVPASKGKPQTEKNKEATRRANTGRVKTADEIAKRVAKMTGQKRTDEFKENHKIILAKYYEENPKGPQSEAHKLAISLGGKGVAKREGHSANVAAAVKGNIAINKDGTEKKVKQHQLQEFLDSGWSLGGKKRTRKPLPV